MARTAIIVQARAGATRLPNKMFLRLGDQTVLEFLLARLKGVDDIDDIIVATTELPADEAIADIAESMNLHVFRGDSADVLSRFQQAADIYESEIVVRICADNVFLQGSEIRRLVQEFRDAGGVLDYLANALPDGTPLIRTGTGLAVEVMSKQALERLKALPLSTFHCEHVTPFLYQNPDLFKLRFSVPPFEIPKDLRLTMDVSEDFDHISSIYRDVDPPYSIAEIVKYLEKHPHIIKAMAEINNRHRK